MHLYGRPAQSQTLVVSAISSYLVYLELKLVSLGRCFSVIYYSAQHIRYLELQLSCVISIVF